MNGRRFPVRALPRAALGLALLAAWAVARGSAGTAVAATNIYESAAWTTPETQIDKLVLRPLAKRGIHPVPCSDAVFVRRAFLDVIGTLPTAQEARDFIRDADPGKRAALIERLLAREEFADYWALKWGDLLRVKAEFPVNLWPNAAQAFHHWIRTSIRDNKPYDRFVREMLTANGSNFRVGPVNFYRAMQDKTPEGIASTVALTFMGTRTAAWPTNTLQGLAAFFSQLSYKPTREWKEEVVFWNPDKELTPATNASPAAATNRTDAATAAKPARAGPLVAVCPDGRKVKLSPDRDPREAFADWLIAPANAWFAPVVVNRIWSWLLGRGLVHEPDDVRPDNPPSHPALLDYLRKECVAQRYDLRHIYRLILNSRTYQVSALAPAALPPDGEALFAVYPLRQLDAEVLIDAINRVSRSSDLYTSPIPEPFTFIPENKPAIALPDGSITSAFLELFGRPARATGMENERINRPTPSQRMHLLNSSHIQRKIEEGPAFKAILAGERKVPVVLEELYLTILSRFPTPDEVSRFETYRKSGVAKSREAWIDLLWALLNSDEFRYRH